MLLSRVYFVKVIHQRKFIENFAESAQCKGTTFVFLKQQGMGYTFQNKVARDQENIFHFKLLCK